MSKKPQSLYKKYFSIADLAKIFGFSTANSFSASKGKQKYIDATEEIIEIIEHSIIESIKKKPQ